MKRILTALLAVMLVFSLSVTSFATDSSAEKINVTVVSVVSINGREVDENTDWWLVTTSASDEFNIEATGAIKSTANVGDLAATFNLPADQAAALNEVLAGQQAVVATITCDIHRNDWVEIDGKIQFTIQTDPYIIAALHLTNSNVWELAGTKAVGETKMTLTTDGLSPFVFISTKTDADDGKKSPQTGSDELPLTVLVVALPVAAVAAGVIMDTKRKKRPQ